MNLSLNKRAIENGLPVALISKIAEHESWRKEVYRPLSYIHKWWARRLGSVFRFILIASLVDENQDVEALFWERLNFPDKIIFDPFMGSGITVQEAIKLNAVAYNMVHTALQKYNLQEVEKSFQQIAKVVQPEIEALYRHNVEGCEPSNVLYYFWVKQISCPKCKQVIDLFKSRVFVKHAYPKTYPEAKSLCPHCDAVNTIKYNDTSVCCSNCQQKYNPQIGSINKSKVHCPNCLHSFTLIDAVRQFGKPLQHRMYAKMVLHQGTQKEIMAIDQDDLKLYEQAEKMLPNLMNEIPNIKIELGNNTKQIINYNYCYWYEMFNARQLVSLAIFAREIKKISNPNVRQLFACLFTGILEFNNMFASFKGIGTGAVRHIFSHHILKPELMPLEANPWGTDKSSGSFSTLFESRILRALKYKDEPFELQIINKKGRMISQKIYQVSQPINEIVVNTYNEFSKGENTYLSVGDSSVVDLPDKVVDLIITDPPFFDNIHYSELADFFYVWLRQIEIEKEFLSGLSTRSKQEVQSNDEAIFTERLAGVFRESYRVLKDDGLLVFTYHHSRNEGWFALYKALAKAGFSVVKTHPVKSEMSVSISIQQAKTPSNFDVIIVCRKLDEKSTFIKNLQSISFLECFADAQKQILILSQGGVGISVGDIKVVLMGSFFVRISKINDIEHASKIFSLFEKDIDNLALQIINSGACKILV